MRSQEINNIKLKYPDEIGFAFNACLMVAEGADVSKMSVKMSSFERVEIVSLDAFKGVCYADVREYVQSFFDTLTFGNVGYEKESKTDLGKVIRFDVNVYSANSVEAFSFEVFYVWGALKVGGQERYNGFKTLTWFKGYPFTFGIYTAGGGSLLFGRDGVAERFINIPEQGIWNVPMKDVGKAKNYYLISDYDGTFEEVTTFDATFDMTFRYVGRGKSEKKIKINIVDSCDDGYYLRWIDRHGFYCYYLFKGGDEQIKVASEIFTRNNLLSHDNIYGYIGNAGRLQQMNREDVKPLCASLVDSDTWDMLADLATSPCVDLYMGRNEDGKPKWMSVNVIPGTYTKSKAVLQDFICSIQMPEVNIQKL